MRLPDGFNYNNCIPTEEDFIAVFNAKKIGSMYKATAGVYNSADDCRYGEVRRFIVAILLDWKACGRYIQGLLEHHPYDKESLQKIVAYVGSNNASYKKFFNKYRSEAVALGQPEEKVRQAADDRKGEIAVNVKNPNGRFFRIIEYSMKYTQDDPSKKQSGARMHLYINKKVSADTWGISVRGSNTYGSKRTELDEPFFATEQEARDFIANIDKQHIPTAVSLEDWRFVISDKPVDYAYDQNARQYVKKADLNGAKKINTICGPCYMLDKCRFYESLEGENMNEAIEKHDELNPKIFEDNKLKPEVREKAEDIVNEFLKILADDEVKLKVRDVILTGSNASFNYNAQSDIDLHIVATTIDFEDPDKLYPKLYNCYRRLFESKFDITFYGIPVEVYVETEADPVVSNGIYSVMYDKWIKEPQKSYVPDIDQKAIEKAAKPWLDEATELLKELDNNAPADEEKIDKYFEDLYELRHRGIYATEGAEFSEENLIFKEVRNSGVMDKLKELKNKIIAKKLSLEEGIKYLDDAHEFLDYGTGEVDGEDVIDVHKGSTFSTQDLLNGSVDAAYDGVIYDIVKLTPTQYFELCSKIQGMKPDEIIDFIGTDTGNIAHIKDVILKYKRKLPLPFVSFSDNAEVSGQEGRHRMYALGEMYGWDTEFPVMIIQDASNKKTIGELLHESIMEDFCLSEKDRRDYAVKIAQIAHTQPIVHQNGIFELYNIPEQEANFILLNLQRQPWIEYVSKAGGKYDYSKISYQGIPALKLNITGKIKIS